MLICLALNNLALLLPIIPQSFTSILWLVLLPVLSLFILRQFVLAVLLEVGTFSCVRTVTAGSQRQRVHACVLLHVLPASLNLLCFDAHHQPPHARMPLQEFSKQKQLAGDAPGIATDVAAMLRERAQVRCRAFCCQACPLAPASGLSRQSSRGIQPCA